MQNGAACASGLQSLTGFPWISHFVCCPQHGCKTCICPADIVAASPYQALSCAVQRLGQRGTTRQPAASAAAAAAAFWQAAHSAALPCRQQRVSLPAAGCDCVGPAWDAALLGMHTQLRAASGRRPVSASSLRPCLGAGTSQPACAQRHAASSSSPKRRPAGDQLKVKLYGSLVWRQLQGVPRAGRHHRRQACLEPGPGCLVRPPGGGALGWASVLLARLVFKNIAR